MAERAPFGRLLKGRFPPSLSVKALRALPPKYRCWMGSIPGGPCRGRRLPPKRGVRRPSGHVGGRKPARSDFKTPGPESFRKKGEGPLPRPCEGPGGTPPPSKGGGGRFAPPGVLVCCKAARGKRRSGPRGPWGRPGGGPSSRKKSGGPGRRHPRETGGRLILPQKNRLPPATRLRREATRPRGKRGWRTPCPLGGAPPQATPIVKENPLGGEPLVKKKAGRRWGEGENPPLNRG